MLNFPTTGFSREVNWNKALLDFSRAIIVDNIATTKTEIWNNFFGMLQNHEL